MQFSNCVLIEFILYVRGSNFVPECVRWYGRSVLQWRVWRDISTHLEYSGSFIISQRDSLLDILHVTSSVLPCERVHITPVFAFVRY